MTCHKTDTGWACQPDEYAMERAVAPDQPEAVTVGSEWMHLPTGSVLPVVAIEDGRIQLGGAPDERDEPPFRINSYIVLLREPQLRREWVCVDPPPLPDNVRSLRS
jgi:hypothetical protein